ncbi:hypothetical protein CR513_53693, partial [Mucuna pruriens]
MRYGGGKRRRVALQPCIILCALVTGLGLLMLALRPLDAPTTVPFPRALESNTDSSNNGSSVEGMASRHVDQKPCATVEEMGKDFRRGVGKESLRLRRIIENQFVANGILAIVAFCYVK